MRKLALAFVLVLLLSPLALPYYHFIRYSTQGGPYVPIYDRFDLTTLPDKTVQFLVSDSSSAALVLAPGDSYTAVVSQLRAAARVWNDVPTSDLRFQFGGIFTPGTTMNSPDVEVIFSDIQLGPGVVGMGGPVVRGDSNGTFTPILKSQVILPQTMTSRPSWSESFFLTAVHELGHALGLQHTYTSSVMSTEITRGTTKAKPLGPDDVAAISLLYPTTDFQSNFGTLAGRVAIAGQGVALASVVALTPNGGAISTLTNPDGTYRIVGLPPGFYYVYAHPLPPANSAESEQPRPCPVNIDPPTDPSGPICPGPAFDLQFYPGTKTAQQTVYVNAGTSTDGIDFNVTRRASVSLFGVQSYSFYTSVPVKPGYVIQSNQRGTLYMAGTGLPASGAGLSINVIGAPEQVAPGGLKQYTAYYLQADFLLNPFSGEGPRHLQFTVGGESYVLPAAFALVKQNPPQFTVSPNADGSLSLTGSSLSAATRVSFDGIPVAVSVSDDGRLIVTPPPASGGYQAFITALNPDGQSSYFILGDASPTYTYDQADVPQVTVQPASLPSGVETVIEVTGTSTAFKDAALPRVGFGTSDIQVRKLMVAGPGRMLAQVIVAPNAVQAVESITTTNGLQLISTPFGFQVTPQNAKQMYVALSSMGTIYAHPGAVLTLPVANTSVAGTVGDVQVSLNDRPATVLGVNGNQVTFQVPALALGPAVLKMTWAGTTVLPSAFAIEPPPPVVFAATNAAGTVIDAQHPVRPGETVLLTVANVLDATVADYSHMSITAGGLSHSVLTIAPNPNQAGTYLVTFVLSAQIPTTAPTVPLTVTQDGHSSQVFNLPVSGQ